MEATCAGTSAPFKIEEELKKLPDSPGVYLMHDKDDEIIYVGKAVSLKKRVRQYFRHVPNRGPKIERMITRIARFEYIVTDSELEALILESNLIKEHRPRYNTMLKDDKAYPYIRITLAEDFPRIVIARSMKKDRSRYYGPYSNAGAVHDMIDLTQKLFHIRPCNKKIESGRVRPCLYYHIGQCDAPCNGGITKEAYREQVDRAVGFLNGHVEDELNVLKERMEEASEALRFEEAAGLRDLIASVQEIMERQKITGTDGEDRDVLAIAMKNTEDESSESGSDAVVQVFFVRDGKLIGREHFYLTAKDTDEAPEVLRSFLTQYYAGTPFIPKEILLPFEIPEEELLSEWLFKRKGSRVVIRIPKKGLLRKLVLLAKENATNVLRKDLNRIKRDQIRTTGAAEEIRAILSLPKLSRVEAFDISNISGFESVGSMVVFENGRPKKNDYRKFRIQSVSGPDDYASMKEILSRRFARALEGSEGFDVLPDLILMDGGKGQVNVALSVLSELGLSIPVAGMVKDDYHHTRGLYYNNQELPIARNSEGFHLITRIQDEAHRFAIEYHRLLRSKGQVRSILDEIPQIGKERRKALMRAFGSLDEIKNADPARLAEVPGMNQRSAKSVYAFFHKEEER